MSEPMSAERLAEIRARADAATKGPWEHNGINGVHTRVGTCVALSYVHNDGHRRADAQFIAAARQDVSDLLAEVDRLRALADRYALMTRALTAELLTASEHRQTDRLKREYMTADEVARFFAEEPATPAPEPEVDYPLTPLAELLVRIVDDEDANAAEQPGQRFPSHDDSDNAQVDPDAYLRADASAFRRTEQGEDA